MAEDQTVYKVEDLDGGETITVVGKASRDKAIDLFKWARLSSNFYCEVQRPRK